jgi:two-component system, cell cycle response regulator DivK
VKTRVLLAEDNKDMLDVLRRGLEWLDYEIIAAKDGIEAVELATSEIPDVIIMDVVMPKMGGLEAASQIKSNPKTQAIPILAVTAMAQAGDQKKCLQSGCDAYIAKPFTFKKLEAAIKRLLKEFSK